MRYLTSELILEYKKWICHLTVCGMIILCCSGTIKEWVVSYTEVGFVGKITGKCSDGSILPSLMYGFDYAGAPSCAVKIEKVQLVPNPKDSRYTYRWATPLKPGKYWYFKSWNKASLRFDLDSLPTDTDSTFLHCALHEYDQFWISHWSQVPLKWYAIISFHWPCCLEQALWDQLQCCLYNIIWGRIWKAPPRIGMQCSLRYLDHRFLLLAGQVTVLNSL